MHGVENHSHSTSPVGRRRLTTVVGGMSDVATSGRLDRTEASLLVRLERTIERAVEVTGRIAGDALATIRDQRLYRVTHTTFAAYVTERWGFSESTAYRMIEAANPQPREVEGSSHGGRNPQPSTGRSSAPHAGPEPSEPHVPHVSLTYESWGKVEHAEAGSAAVRFEPGQDEPPTAQRVLVVWTV